MKIPRSPDKPVLNGLHKKTFSRPKKKCSRQFFFFCETGLWAEVSGLANVPSPTLRYYQTYSNVVTVVTPLCLRVLADCTHSLWAYYETDNIVYNDTEHENSKVAVFMFCIVIYIHIYIFATSTFMPIEDQAKGSQPEAFHTCMEHS